MADHRIRVALIFGGRSGEHDVSCFSAAGMLSPSEPRPLRGRPDLDHAWGPLGRRFGHEAASPGAVDVPLIDRSSIDTVRAR